MTTYVIANASDAHEAAEAVGMGVEEHDGWPRFADYCDEYGYFDRPAFEQAEYVWDYERLDREENDRRNAQWPEFGQQW